jgi:hypothetical protein
MIAVVAMATIDLTLSSDAAWRQHRTVTDATVRAVCPHGCEASRAVAEATASFDRRPPRLQRKWTMDTASCREVREAPDGEPGDGFASYRETSEAPVVPGDRKATEDRHVRRH